MNEDTIEVPQKLIFIRKYLYEICLLVLAACVGFLFHLYVGIETDFRTFVTTKNEKMIEVIQENTSAIKSITK